MRVVLLTLLCACASSVPVQVAPASQSVDIVEVFEGRAFTPPLAGVYLSHEAMADILRGAAIEAKPLRIRTAKAERLAEIDSAAASKASERVADLEAEKRSWWQVHKFELGLGIGIVFASLCFGGAYVAVSR